ncbi:MAG: hypothetical protein IIT37_11020, partial [Bacteroidales bacterium]|nr:hypothetical protein [Bacteroidales bacterium]
PTRCQHTKLVSIDMVTKKGIYSKTEDGRCTLMLPQHSILMEIGGKNRPATGIAHCGINYNQKKNKKTTRRKILTHKIIDTFFILIVTFL